MKTLAPATRRAMSAQTATLAAGTALAACGADTGGQTTAAAGTQPITVEAWTRTGQFAELIEVYNPGQGQADRVTVAVTRTASGLDLQNKLMAAAASDTVPEFATVDLNIAPLFNVKRVFADLTREFNQLKYRDQFPPAMVRNSTQDGKIFQVPFWVDTLGFYWNKNLFRAAGLPPDAAPKTWDEMTAHAVKLTRAPDAWGVTIPYNASATFNFMPWVYANGGTLFTADFKRSAVNSEQGAGAFQLWADLAQKRQVTPDGFRTGTAFNATELFVLGKLGMYHSGPGLIDQLKRDAPHIDFGTSVIPVGPRGARTGSAPGGETMGFSPKTPNRARLWRLIEWLVGDDAQVEYLVAKRSNLPVLTRQVENRYYKEEPRFTPFRESAQAATPTWNLHHEDLKAVMLPEYMAALGGAKEPRAALRDMSEAIDRVLAQPA
jgi:multiple sugar transport system substrate-binding protein